MSNTGTMVDCLSCNKVVWAYDSSLGDVRGLLNMMKMPCRLCGARGNYDGWSIDADRIARFGQSDAWQTMRKIAEIEGLEWAISSDCVWFKDGVPAFKDDMPDDREAHYNERAEEMP